MRSARSWVALSAAGLAVSAATAAMGAPAATAAGGAHHPTARVSAKHALQHAKAFAHSKPDGRVAPASRITFDLVLSLRHAARANAFVTKVSTPGSADYHHYLTDAQWEHRFSPSRADVAAAKAWLRKNGFSAGAVPQDRLFVAASGSAKRIEKAFSTHLGYYKVNGHRVRLASSNLKLPTAISGTVSGVVGVNQYINRPDLALKGATPQTASAKPADAEPAPPAGFRNPQPCSASYGQKVDHADAASLYAPYTAARPYDICGYLPSQLRSAYNVGQSTSSNGTGVAIAIVDAYDSPTLLSDAQHYAALNDPSHPLASSQFFNVAPATVDDAAECGGSGWYDEQALDVESSHAMAPGADILFVGAQDCQDPSLLAALQTAVTSGASVVSDSWGDTLGDLLEDADAKAAFDNTFTLADSTGVSVLFSSGDDGDNFADFGLAVPDYPPTSPYVTAVGGTALQINSSGARNGELGWSTAKQTLCAGVPTTNCGTATTPAGALAWQAGGGGGTSYNYLQPGYQANVVPTALADRNEAIFGPQPLRVVPDISMDADAQTGMLIGLTQTFPGGVKYDQFKEGGTSLASPLLAGVVADTDQVSGVSEGFLNPTLYKAYSEYPAAFKDIVPATNPNSSAVVRVDYANTVDGTDGFNVSLRVLGYEGPETYCDATGNCATRPVTLTTAKGFDSMTGLGVAGPSFIADISKF
jgi:subtilase family serine protease